jgi:hypothetical protein
MELDELKELWQEQDRRLDALLSVNRAALHRAQLAPVETRMRRLARLLELDLLLDGALLLWLGSFIGDHYAEPRFLVPAALLHLCVIAAGIAGVRQWRAVRAVDYGEPVLAIQRRLEGLRIQRLKLLRAVLALSPLLWLPMLIVGLRFLGVDAYARFDPSWMLANLLLGVGVLAIAYWASRRYAGRVQGSPRLQRAMRHLAGHTLHAAEEALERLQSMDRAAV